MDKEHEREEDQEEDNSDSGSDDSSSDDDEEIEIDAADLDKLMALEADLEGNPNLYDKHVEVRQRSMVPTSDHTDEY